MQLKPGFWSIRKGTITALAGLLVLLSPVVRAQGKAAESGNWRLEKDKDGIQVYTRFTEQSRLKEVKVHCEAEGTLDQVVAYLTDIDNHPKFVYRVKTAYLIKRVSARELIYYTETEMPWPVKNRDVVMHLVLEPDADGQRLVVLADNAPGMVPVHPDKVRIPYWHSRWDVRKTGDKRLSMDYTFKVDPGGTLPAWLVNLTATMGPFTSFSVMKQHLKTIRPPERDDRLSNKEMK